MWVTIDLHLDRRTRRYLLSLLAAWLAGFTTLSAMGQIVDGALIQMDEGQMTMQVRAECHCYCETAKQDCPVCETCPVVQVPSCFQGPGVPVALVSRLCRVYDIDGDGDCDLRDFAEVQR